MNNHTQTFMHTRSPKCIQKHWLNRGLTAEALQSVKEAEFEGELTWLGRAFGSDCYIRLFGGESFFFISTTGGHMLSYLIVKGTVDGPHEVLYSNWGHTTSESTIPARKILEDELPKEAFKLLEGKLF